MTQRKIYIEVLASRMRSAGQNNWSYNDMQDLCDLAGMNKDWNGTTSRAEEEDIVLSAANKLGVEIRHYIPKEVREETVEK